MFTARYGLGIIQVTFIFKGLINKFSCQNTKENWRQYNVKYEAIFSLLLHRVVGVTVINSAISFLDFFFSFRSHSLTFYVLHSSFLLVSTGIFLVSTGVFLVSTGFSWFPQVFSWFQQVFFLVSTGFSWFPQVFLGFPVSKSKCWGGSQDSKLPLHASHVALAT